jgi:exodeoxyribonuclease-3
MRLLTLNIRHGSGRRAAHLVEWLARSAADVVLLTEYRENANSNLFKTSLSDIGYDWQASSSIVAGENAVFLASRAPFVVAYNIGGPGFQHRMLLAEFEDFKLLGAYFPQGAAKKPVFDFLISDASRLLGETGMLIGDLNTGKPYLDEVGKTFACVDGFEGLEAVGLVDAWRSRNPAMREFSWFSSSGNGFRIDHVFCTSLLDKRVSGVAYDHGPRESAATDHSALMLEIGASFI